MKKTVVWTLTFALAVIGFSACKSKGGAASEDILTWIPQAAQGVIVIDVKRGMTTEFVDKSIKENKKYEEYQKFIKDTGIDPQKDIYALAVALMSETDAEGKMKAQPGIVASLAYKKDVLLAKLKEKATGVVEKDYDGVTLYGVKDEADTQPMFGAFYDETHILFGTEGTIKAMIDVAKKKTPNVLKSEALTPLMKTVNKSAMLWAAIAIPKELSSEAQKSPMTADLESIKAVLLSFDYKNKALEFEIRGVGGDADKNKKLADTLNGFKALGGMAGGEKPEIGEFINKIEISSAPDHVKIYANLPEELLSKLSKTAQTAVEEKLGAAKAEEKKVEKTEEIKK